MNDLVEVTMWKGSIRRDWIIIDIVSNGGEAILHHIGKPAQTTIELSKLKHQEKEAKVSIIRSRIWLLLKCLLAACGAVFTCSVMLGVIIWGLLHALDYSAVITGGSLFLILVVVITLIFYYRE